VFTSHVLLYHSTFAKVPDHLKHNLHNVTPEELYRQVSWLKRHFDLVSVDEYLEGNRLGCAALTFDDGYDSVFSEALPVLNSLDAPFTVFINGSSLSGRPFWRDGVRYLINNGLVREFLLFYSRFSRDADLLDEGNFFAMSKSPRINSRRIHQAIEEFLQQRHMPMEELVYCVHDDGVMRKNPALPIGNHSFNHYVMSSLTDEEQELEIRAGQELIRLLGVRTSNVFSLPFGGYNDVNKTTVRLIAQYGYKGFLYANDLVEISRFTGRRAHEVLLPSADRYMVEPTLEAFQKQIFKIAARSVLFRLGLKRIR
jgi:peptidoglycan/xylan/chitin deacetylase (PgdA/CDA1 family)